MKTGKLMIFSFLAFICFTSALASAEKMTEMGQSTQQIASERQQNNEIQAIHKTIETITQNEAQLKHDINELLKTINQQPAKSKIYIESKTDINQFLLIVLTMITVLSTTYYSVKTLVKKTEESIQASTSTIIAQRDISEVKVKMEVLSGNRQQWINTLRTEISEYLATLLSLQAELIAGEVAHFNIISNLYKETRLHRAKIHLLINPVEPDNIKLIDLINSAPSYVKDADKLAICEREIIDISQQILKREWERVKAIE